MALFKKKADPISERAKTLNAEIAALQTQIRKLSARVEQGASRPRLRQGAPSAGQAYAEASKQNAPGPIFEQIDRQRLKAGISMTSSGVGKGNPEVDKHSLLAVWQRFLSYFRGPPPANPKLLNYLAAGSIQGLRPLRYEKRIARYRLIFLCLCLFFVLWVLFGWVRRH
jgi:hypothetical protein